MFMDRKIQYRQDVSSSQLIYIFNAIPIRIPACYCVGIDKLILKFLLRGTKSRIAKTIEGKEQIRGLRYHPTSRLL